MTSTDHPQTASTTEILRGLRGLRTQAPGALLPGVLVETGLADGYAVMPSALGEVFVAFNRLGVSAVAVAGDPAAFEAGFLARFGRAVHRVPAPPGRLGDALADALLGRGGRSLRFDLRGLSGFQQAVLDKAREIPPGEVRPYAWVAAEIGRPGAVRAVGTALGHNPVPLLIPCHRVVQSDGRVGSYALGPAAKRAVLAAEGVDPDELEAWASTGVRLVGSDTTKVFCFPTCRAARRIRPGHRVAFPTARAAAAAGFRPCRHCRPKAAALAGGEGP